MLSIILLLLLVKLLFPTMWFKTKLNLAFRLWVAIVGLSVVIAAVIAVSTGRF